jgi:hypothetical protein
MRGSGIAGLGSTVMQQAGVMAIALSMVRLDTGKSEPVDPSVDLRCYWWMSFDSEDISVGGRSARYQCPPS